MTAKDSLTIFREARTFQGSLVDLHPLKLDRWHRGLVGLPDAIYMQMGCPALYEQIGKALDGVKALVDMLGEKNLPVDPQEIARRRIGAFTWHVVSETTETGTAQCSLTWSQKETTWEVTCSLAKGTRKMVQDFEQGFDVATAWVSVLENPEG